MTERRAAFYALRPGGWRDYVSLLHLPYTAWHLSYVVIGAAIAPEWLPERLAVALVAFFLGLGIGAHALDELQGRPLGTRIPRAVLWTLAVISIAAAVAIGTAAAAAWTWWLLAFVVFGGFMVVAYNLELFGGRLHTDAWFALTWGALPLLATYLACAETISWAALAAATFAAAFSYAQRALSTPVRLVRRQAEQVTGTIRLTDGGDLPVTDAFLTRASERALQAMTAAVIALAVALVLVRV